MFLFVFIQKWSDYKLLNVNLELQQITIHERANRKTRFNGDEKAVKTFAAFEFDSVPDRRPFLLSRDLVHARLSGTQSEPFQVLHTTEYQSLNFQFFCLISH